MITQLLASALSSAPLGPTADPEGIATSVSLVGLLLILLTPILIRVSRVRALAQPTPAHPEAEREVLARILADPSLYVYVHQLEAAHFVDPARGELWSAIAAHNQLVQIPEVGADLKQAMRELERIADDIPTDLVDHLESIELSDPARLELSELNVSRSASDRDRTIEQAGLIYNAGADRLEYAGNSTVEITGDPSQPLRRTLPPTTHFRRILVAVMLGLGGTLSLMAGLGEQGDAAGALATGALLLLTIGSVIWTLVDLDTMYIDLPSFYSITIAAWVLAIGAGALDGELSAPLSGLIVSGAIVLFIEVVNQIFRRIRGQHGMGGGDYLLIFATIGVPVAVVGDWQLGQGALILSLLAGLLGWVVTRLTKPGFTKASPYAFGPYLASGWLLALALWMVR